MTISSYSVQPVILRLVAPAEDSAVGLPSPGVLENLAGMSRTLSSLVVMGESDPLAIPNNSSALSWNMSYECSAAAGSTSMGWDLSRMLSTAYATSASVGGVPRFIDGGDVLDAQLLINGLSLSGFRGGLVLGHCLLFPRRLTLAKSESWWYALCFCRVPGFWLSGRKLEPSCHAGPWRGSETQVLSFLNPLSEVCFPS